VGIFATILVAASVEAIHAWDLRAYRGVGPVCRIETSRRVVALSFDDGPDPAYTPEVLQLLLAQHAHATFFVTGEHATDFPQLVAHIVASGNELGNHTWSHPRLTSLSDDQAISQFDRTEKLLARYAAVHLARAPYGEIKATTLVALEAERIVPIHWSIALDHYVDSLDLSPQATATAVAAVVMPGDIILAHDAHDGGIDRDKAMATLRFLLPMLRSQGYQLVSVGMLLNEGIPVRAASRPWVWQSGFSCPQPDLSPPAGQ
jgi:peptidoglycan/xylan/chitin deacetylase (PgdA/CDA1 family)